MFSFHKIFYSFILSFITSLILMTGLSFSVETVDIEKFNISITFPDKWNVNKDMPYPMVLGADNYKNKSHIAVTYMQNVSGKKPTKGFMKQLLKETEDKNYKKTKPNYKRLNVVDYKVAGKDAVWMEFTSSDSSGDYHEVVVVFPVSNEYFLFFGLRCYEGIYSEVLTEYKSILESIVIH